MATVQKCDVCGGLIDEGAVGYGPLEVSGEFVTLTIIAGPDIGDVCPACMHKAYYAVAREAFEELRTKRPRKVK
jgi:hypothetical protein